MKKLTILIVRGLLCPLLKTIITSYFIAALFLLILCKTKVIAQEPSAVSLFVGQQIPESLWSLPLYNLLPNTSAKTFFLEDFKGKPIVIDFWASWCIPCLNNMPKLDSLSRVKGISFQPLMVNTLNRIDSLKNMQAFVKDFLIGKETFCSPVIMGSPILQASFPHHQVPHYSDMFFLNNYQAVLSRHDNSAPVKQVFDLERDHRMTALQAYRLLSGYSFEKEILFRAGQENNQEPAEKRAVWLKLNLAVTDAYGNHPLHRFYPEYNFDLEKSVGKYPFYLAGEDRKEKLLKELKNGGLAELELMVDGKPLGVFVAAEPQFKTLTIYSRDMVRIPDAQIFAPGQNQSQAAQSTGQTTQSGSVSPDHKPWKGDEDIVQAPKPGR